MKTTGWIPWSRYHEEETTGQIPQVEKKQGGNHGVESMNWIPQGGYHEEETMGWKQQAG